MNDIPTERAAEAAELQRLYEQGQLSEVTYRAALRGLGVDPVTMLAAQEVRGDVVTGGKNTDFDLRETQAHTQYLIKGNYYAEGAAEPPALDGATALERYLCHVIDDNRCLRLQGIRAAGKLVSIELEQVYITLTATARRTVAAEEELLAELQQCAPGEARRRELMHARATVQQVKVPVHRALAEYPRLVVLGDPGCGKTTLLRYLALTYARDLGGELGADFRSLPDFGSLKDLVQERLELAEHRLPLLLPLRDFARHLERQYPDDSTDGPKLLLDYLHAYFANQDMALPARFFAEPLQRGECIVLLDGVDEVAELRTRQRVARIIERFTRAYPANRYVVTSRVVGYTGAARLGEGYEVTTVRDFTQTDIARFVTYWNRAVEAALAGGETPYAEQQARKQTQALLEAIARNERVRELAVNPLLLTVVALVQRYRAQLPERRTELYEEAIEVLLGKWDEAKGLETKNAIAGLELDAGDRRSVLEPVALWMMEQRAREIELDDLRTQLAAQFAAMVADQRQARKAVAHFLQVINERSGLLGERGLGIYAFNHLTFQEHLAARAVADKADYVEYTRARLGDSWWREVILLEAGYLSTQGKRRVTALIEMMMNEEKEPELYHNLVLAAECLRDVGVARVEGDLRGEVQRRIRQEFAQPLRQGSALKARVQRRAVAAEALARIERGGSGTQPAFWRLPYGEPVWVEVPAGEFWMGGDEYGDERPVHRVHVDQFQIARVPVTNAQYQIFVAAAGHNAPSHWDDGQAPRGLESHPVVKVSWYDAVKYCAWLAQVTGKNITLPSEAEWEKAARGAQDKREYPWGETWDATKCNSDELGIGTTTPVGIFPEGGSPDGCLDMLGNVWEWTRSCVADYPYVADDGREDLTKGEDVRRVVRGGAFHDHLSIVRCASRDRNVPNDWDNYVGFRVVVSPISRAAGL